MYFMVVSSTWPRPGIMRRRLDDVRIGRNSTAVREKPPRPLRRSGRGRAPAVHIPKSAGARWSSNQPRIHRLSAEFWIRHARFEYHMMSSSAKADDPVTTGRAVFPLHSRCILDAPPPRGMTEELGQRNRKLL